MVKATQQQQRKIGFAAENTSLDFASSVSLSIICKAKMITFCRQCCCWASKSSPSQPRESFSFKQWAKGARHFGISGGELTQVGPTQSKGTLCKLWGSRSFISNPQTHESDADRQTDSVGSVSFYNPGEKTLQALIKRNGEYFIENEIPFEVC